MYDLSKEFSSFYDDYVVLPRNKQNELRDKRDLNIKRLREGLEEYNKENGTNFKISETRTQGSMAMHTIVQNDQQDYDIDVAIVFDKNNIESKGPIAIKNVVVDALKRKCKGFKTDPEAKTNCVRIVYESGYHVDFAIYRRFKEDASANDYKYEHAGSSWSERNPAAINSWFNDKIAEKGQVLRKVIRLSKMFCKSHSWTNMPGGLIQTVVCDEQLQSYDRIDEAFYYTMNAIKERLNTSIEVCNPTDTSFSLLQTEEHRNRMNKWKNRLEDKIADLEVLFEDSCTKDKAMAAWHEFFDHDFWANEVATATMNLYQKSIHQFRNTEEFIEDLYNMDEQYSVSIQCIVSKAGFRDMPIFRFLEKYNGWLLHGLSISCSIASTSAPSYDKVLWKVRNVGRIAEEKDMIRGQIENRGLQIRESSDFFGEHYIECYLIKDNKCIAVGHVDVPIGNH